MSLLRLFCSGVDDAFLLLGAWRVTDERLPNEQRVGLAMAEAGTSITVTTLTDFFGFGQLVHALFGDRTLLFLQG